MKRSKPSTKALNSSVSISVTFGTNLFVINYYNMENKKNNQVINESELGVMSTFDKNQHFTIIEAIGVGGGGINAVNLMYQNIDGVTFGVLDSDRQQLMDSPVPNRVLLRPDTTHRSAAEESESEIAAFFDGDTKMVIIVAGLGGDTGTDVAPVVARIAREKEVALTVGIVTIPFLFEGIDRIQMAHAGINELSKYVDALFIIDNQRLTEIFNDLDKPTHLQNPMKRLPQPLAVSATLLWS